MILKIHSYTHISDLKLKFHKRFPYLRLEFFRPQGNPAVAFRKKNMITDGQTTIGTISTLKRSGTINIEEQQTVSQLENQFRNDFGLHVQVFRKSGNTWLETTTTDDWTLSRQNSKGKEKDTVFTDEPAVDDIHEQL